MNVAILRTFVEVMRRGSFAAVARDRDVDPSSISRSIAALEDELGLRLFQRTTRRLSPTEAGLVYFDRVEPIIAELERARLRAVDVSEGPRGTLRIGAPVSFAQLNIVPLLPELAIHYPDLSFDLRLTDATQDLVEEHIDVAIRMGPLRDSGLIASKLSPMIFKICASPSYIETHGRPQTPQDLEQHKCLLLAMPGFDARWRLRDRGSDVTEVPVQGPLRTSNAIALKQCALAGMGIILQARWIVGRELRDGSLVDLFPNHEVTAANFEAPAVWLLYPSRAYLPLKVRVFADFLKEKFKSNPPWDAPTRR